MSRLWKKNPAAFPDPDEAALEAAAARSKYRVDNHPSVVEWLEDSEASDNSIGPDNAEIEEVERQGPRRRSDEEFRRSWNGFVRNVRIAEGLVDARFNELRTAGLLNAIEPYDRSDSGLSLADDSEPSSAEGKGKGKAKATEIDEAELLALSAKWEASKGRLRDLIDEHASLSGLSPEKVAFNFLPPTANNYRSCTICMEELIVLKFPLRPAASGCKHPIKTCKDCLSSWLASELEDKGHAALKCPDCSEAMSYVDVRRAASRETFALYDCRATQAALADLPNFAWCLAPNCGSGQLNEEQAYANFMECVACKYEQCLHHHGEWHWHEACEEYDYRLSGRKAVEDEAKAQAMLEAVSKLCPGPGCKWRLQKIDGCDQ